MRRFPALVVMVLGMWLPAVSAQAANATVARAIDGFVRPAYAAFAGEADAARVSIERLCAAPSAQALDDARSAFGGLVRAWSSVETIRFGPITEENRLERVLYWPDRKGIGLKQVQAALAGEDPDAADAARLPRKSVALQGLGALEFLLFGSGADQLLQADAYRCRFGRAVAANVAGIAKTVSDAWNRPEGIARVWSEPGAGNASYASDEEALTELLDILVHGLEMTRDVRLNGFLGKTSGEDRPKSALFWRSGGTVASIESNLAGLRDLYQSADFAPLLPADSVWMDQSARFEFANAVNALRAVDGPVADALADPARRSKLDYARIVTSSLSETFGKRLAGALKLSAGFSSLDGD